MTWRDQENRLRDFCCHVTTFTVLYSWKATLPQVSTDLLQDSGHTMFGLNAHLKGFLEQVNRLQEANQRLEAQIADWSVRRSSRSQDWSRQEQTVKELRAQVGKLLMENAQLALQSDRMKSRAAAIQARCEAEEHNTWCLEQQVAMLRDSKRKAEQSSVTLQEELRHSMTELQEMNQEFEGSITGSPGSAAAAGRLLRCSVSNNYSSSSNSRRGGRGWHRDGAHPAPQPNQSAVRPEQTSQPGLKSTPRLGRA